MLADETFAHRRAAASGTAEGEVWVDGTPATGFTVSIRRVVPATSIPAEFRSFVGNDLHVRYTEVWQAPSEADAIGTFSVEIVGAPGHAAGALGLAPSEAGTDFLATGEIKVTIPLFGGMIERVLADAVIKGLSQELSAADAWLAS
jgi:hypothetical protein